MTSQQRSDSQEEKTTAGDLQPDPLQGCVTPGLCEGVTCSGSQAAARGKMQTAFSAAALLTRALSSILVPNLCRCGQGTGLTGDEDPAKGQGVWARGGGDPGPRHRGAQERERGNRGRQPGQDTPPA